MTTPINFDEIRRELQRLDRKVRNLRTDLTVVWVLSGSAVLCAIIVAIVVYH